MGTSVGQTSRHLALLVTSEPASAGHAVSPRLFDVCQRSGSAVDADARPGGRATEREDAA